MKIIQLPAQEWFKFRDIRLEALKNDPLAFGSTYQEETEASEESWKARLNSIWFAVEGDDIMGMIGMLQDSGSAGRHRAHIISFYVRPRYRGLGLGKKLVEYLQALAPTRGIRKYYLHVTTSQKEAISLYERLGFVKSGLLKENTHQNGCYYDQYLMEWFVDENNIHTVNCR